MKIESKYILPICIKIHVPLQGIKSAPLKYQKVPCCKIPVFYLKGRKKPFKKSPCIPTNVVAVAVFQFHYFKSNSCVSALRGTMPQLSSTFLQDFIKIHFNKYSLYYEYYLSKTHALILFCSIPILSNLNEILKERGKLHSKVISNP